MNRPYWIPAFAGMTKLRDMNIYEMFR